MCDGGLVPDVMHDILEGALQYEIKLLLKRMMEIDKHFSLGKETSLPVLKCNITTMCTTQL